MYAYCCDLIDTPVSIRALEMLEPHQIEIAIKAVEELEKRENALDNQWRMRIERAEYEANLAQRRYEEVDPANRLVAATLETRWNDALLKVEAIKRQFNEHKREKHITATAEQKARLLSLGKDLRRLWKSPSTKAKDRKRVLRLLIKDIVVEKLGKERQIILHVRWQGEACEDIPVQIPPKRSDQIRYRPEIINKVRELAKTLPNREIASFLNGQGLVSATGKRFTVSMIQWIRFRYGIPSYNLKRPEELSVKEVAEKYNVSTHVVYYWIKRKVIHVRRIDRRAPYWITIDSEKEKELIEWVRNSPRIPKNKDSYS